MNKLIWIRILFIVLGLASLAVLYFAFVIGYVFGPLAFNPLEAKPHYIIDMFLYKDYFVIGLIHLSSLVAGILSLIVVFKPERQWIHKALFSYLLVVLFLVSQVLWSNFLVEGSRQSLQEKERILQEEAKTRFQERQ